MTRVRALQLNAADNVATVLEDALAGSDFAGATVRIPIPAGHKIALHDIAAGAPVRKYGQIIGVASEAICAGAHVHVHNITLVGVEQAHQATTATRASPPVTGATFNGYRRASGGVGTRNFIGVLTTVNCSATVAQHIARRFSEADLPTNVDGVAAFTHSGGCGAPAAGDATRLLDRTLAGYARHPNFAGVLLVGLGCEVNQLDRLMNSHGLSGGNVHAFNIQDAGGTRQAIERGVSIVRELLQDAARCRREPASAADLIVGLQCGGSDAWSGVTANPSLGAAADLLVADGGAIILSETPEIYGAEHLLLSRAMDENVGDKLRAKLAWWEDYVRANGADLNNNPSPGNIKGGISTILEKSLGAVAKSGSTPLCAVYDYAESIKARGFVFMDSPGYDPCSATGQIAAGANLIAFTTGRGSVFGSKPAPCLKLASNHALARQMSEDIDIDCSPVLDDVSVADMGHLIYARMIAVANGERTASEEFGLGDHEFVPWRLGATL